MQLIAVGLKTLIGGTLVVGFSALGDGLKPKAFAGLFAAAPSVALAGGCDWLYTAVMAWRAVTMKRPRKAAPG